MWSPDGSVTFTPDPTTATNLELSYEVADDFGATATGRIVVNIRPVAEDSRPPDARNDAAVTVVGKPVTLDVLAHDVDPDGDPLAVSSQPTLVRSPSGGSRCARGTPDPSSARTRSRSDGCLDAQPAPRHPSLV